MVSPKDSDVKSRFMDHIISACASAIVLLFVGWLAGYAQIKESVAEMKTSFLNHEKQNAEYRERMAKAKETEDAKWDARITRLENCFIIRTCK